MRVGTRSAPRRQTRVVDCGRRRARPTARARRAHVPRRLPARAEQAAARPTRSTRGVSGRETRAPRRPSQPAQPHHLPSPSGYPFGIARTGIRGDERGKERKRHNGHRKNCVGVGHYHADSAGWWTGGACVHRESRMCLRVGSPRYYYPTTRAGEPRTGESPAFFCRKEPSGRAAVGNDASVPAVPPGRPTQPSPRPSLCSQRIARSPPQAPQRRAHRSRYPQSPPRTGPRRASPSSGRWR